MKIEKFEITNFRSISALSLPLNKYGAGKNESNTTFLVGINESGKSAILDAISLINGDLETIDYEENCFLQAQDDDELIEIITYVDIEWEKHRRFWRNQIIEKSKLDKDFVDSLVIETVMQIAFIDGSNSGKEFDIEINSDLPLYQYIINTTTKTVAGKIQSTETIEKLAEFNNISDEITSENAKSLLKENQKMLSKTRLEIYLSKILESTLQFNMPKIKIWKSKPEYLINDKIDLEDFKEDTSISIPLKNIFHIYGKKTDDDIKKTIERALENQAT